MNDVINHPKHYTNKSLECIDILEDCLEGSGFIGFCVGNILKYAYRYNDKNGLEDLKKAKWYLLKLSEYCKKNFLNHDDVEHLPDSRATIENMMKEYLDEYDFSTLNTIVEGEMDKKINGNISKLLYLIVLFQQIPLEALDINVVISDVLTPALDALDKVIDMLEVNR